MKKSIILLILIVLILVIFVAGCAMPSIPQPKHRATPSPIPGPAPTDVRNPGTPGNLSVYFLDVGQGDSELIREGNVSVLIDGGPTSMGATAERDLNTLGVSRLDAVILTHAHEDHAGGLLTVLADVPAAGFYDTGYSYTTSTYSNLLKLVDQENIPYHETTLKTSKEIHIGDLDFTLLSPGYDHQGYDIPNDDSIVLRLVWGSVSFMFMGDAGTPVENEIMDSGARVQSTILKVSHHGSSSANSQQWLQSVAPDVAVISAGQDNSYNLPNSGVVSRLKNDGITTYDTMDDGTVKIETDGNSYTVTTEAI